MVEAEIVAAHVADRLRLEAEKIEVAKIDVVRRGRLRGEKHLARARALRVRDARARA